MCTVIVTVPTYLFTRENNCKIDVTYSGTSIQGTPSGSRKVSPEWRLGWGLLLINLQIEYFFFKSAFEFAVVNICSSRIMHKKSCLTLSLQNSVSQSHKCSTSPPD